jgi:hypothetical protein
MKQMNGWYRTTAVVNFRPMNWKRMLSCEKSVDSNHYVSRADVPRPITGRDQLVGKAEVSREVECVRAQGRPLGICQCYIRGGQKDGLMPWQSVHFDRQTNSRRHAGCELRTNSAGQNRRLVRLTVGPLVAAKSSFTRFIESPFDPLPILPHLFGPPISQRPLSLTEEPQ